MSSASASKKVIFAALAGNLLISITKFVAAALTGSSAILSEGIHSIVDTGNQILLLHGINRSQRPPDEHYPFGHGKEIYFWSFIVAILIFAIGAGVSIYEGIQHMLHPHPIANVYINYIILGSSLVFEGFSWFFAYREFNKQKGDLGFIEAVHNGKDPSIFMVFFEDTAALVGLAVAFFGILLGQIFNNPLFDGLASVVIGLVLAATAVWLAVETKGLLIGESANKKVTQGIREIVSSFKEIENINEVLTMHMGPEFVLVNLSADFVDTVSAHQVENTIAQIDTKIKERFPEVKRLFVEAESRKTKNANE